MRFHRQRTIWVLSALAAIIAVALIRSGSDADTTLGHFLVALIAYTLVNVTLRLITYDKKEGE